MINTAPLRCSKCGGDVRVAAAGVECGSRHDVLGAAHTRPPACTATGKRGFTSSHEAKRHNRGNGHSLTAYQCHHCRKWHVAKRQR